MTILKPAFYQIQIINDTNEKSISILKKQSSSSILASHFIASTFTDEKIIKMFI